MLLILWCQESNFVRNGICSDTLCQINRHEKNDIKWYSCSDQLTKTRLFRIIVGMGFSCLKFSCLYHHSHRLLLFWLVTIIYIGQIILTYYPIWYHKWKKEAKLSEKMMIMVISCKNECEINENNNPVQTDSVTF